MHIILVNWYYYYSSLRLSRTRLSRTRLSRTKSHSPWIWLVFEHLRLSRTPVISNFFSFLLGVRDNRRLLYHLYCFCYYYLIISYLSTQLFLTLWTHAHAHQIAGVSAHSGSTLVLSKSDICNNGKAVDQGLELSQSAVTSGVQLKVCVASLFFHKP